MKFRKKPVVIEAFQFGISTHPQWFQGRLGLDAKITEPGVECKLKTLEGEMTVKFGDWIIRGVKNELYSCKPDIFKMTYELAEPVVGNE